jgi:hypothetical protein
MPTPASHSPRARKSLLLLCLAASWASGVLLAGCGIFNPEDEGGGPPPPPQPYPILSFPSQVLDALELAYAARDSVKIKELYDSTYTGQSIDLFDPGNQIDLTYADEVGHVAALARAQGVSTYLELGSDAIWQTLPSDDPSHPEWAVIQISGFSYRIEVTEGQETLGAIGEAGTFQEFAFTPTEDPGSPTGKLWKIVRWKETGNSEPPPPPNP